MMTNRQKPLALFLLLGLLLGSSACSFTSILPTAQTEPPQTFTIVEPLSEDSRPMKISIEMGAGDLEMRGGSDLLLEGEILYNIPEWQPEIIRDERTLLIRQSRRVILLTPGREVTNHWQLKLGSVPIDLDITAGAYEGRLNLSNVALTRLNIQDGASRAELRFDQPNPIQMESLRYRTGASEVSLYGLGNANPAFLYFEGGAGSYTLDFSGSLRQDIQANISAGVSNLKIIIPTGTAARIIIRGGVSNVQPRGIWNISNNVYETMGSSPKIEIHLDMGVGNLELIHQ